MGGESCYGGVRSWIINLSPLSIGHQYMYIHDVYIICCRTKWLSATVTTCSCLWHLSSAFCRHSSMPLIHTVSNRLFILRDNLTSNKELYLLFRFAKGIREIYNTQSIIVPILTVKVRHLIRHFKDKQRILQEYYIKILHKELLKCLLNFLNYMNF